MKGLKANECPYFSSVGMTHVKTKLRTPLHIWSFHRAAKKKKKKKKKKQQKKQQQTILRFMDAHLDRSILVFLSLLTFSILVGGIPLLTPLHSERPQLHTTLAFLSAIGYLKQSSVILIKDGIFSFKTIPKNLYPSYEKNHPSFKTHLCFWDILDKKKHASY